jgi:hypothetical protein
VWTTFLFATADPSRVEKARGGRLDSTYVLWLARQCGMVRKTKRLPVGAIASFNGLEAKQGGAQMDWPLVRGLALRPNLGGSALRL